MNPDGNALLWDYLTMVDDSCIAILPHALRIVDELGVPAVLADGPIGVREVAVRVGADPDALYRLLRAIASVGLVAEAEGRRFALTPRGECLLPDHELSICRSLRNVDTQHAWAGAADNLREGRSAFAAVHGSDFFAHKDDNALAHESFMVRMRERAARCYGDAVALVDWSTSAVVMDVGGNDGFMLRNVLGANDRLRGVLFDRPPVIASVAAQRLFAPFGRRAQLAAGDFFHCIPDGADTHVLSSILHDWPDSQAAMILGNSRAALPAGGRLLLVEMVVPDGSVWHSSKWSDIGMLVQTGGRERTEAELNDLLAGAGFTIQSVFPIAGSPYSLIEAY